MPLAESVRTVPFDANLRRLEGKKGLVIGIANENSIAYGCARAFRSFGAELAITYLNDKAKPYVEPLAGALEAPIFMPLDVQVEGQLEAVFEAIEQRWGRLDFALHSIAFAPRADLHGRVVDCSREGFLLAMDVSCHSFIRMARLAEPLMKDGGALFTMSYFGAERVVENYNLMGPVKAALEASARYSGRRARAQGDPRARDLARPAQDPRGIRHRAVRRAARQGGGARAGAQPGDHRGRRLRDRRARDRRRQADHRRYHLHRRRLPHHGLIRALRRASLGTAPFDARAASTFYLKGWADVETENRIERTIGLVMLAVLAIGCLLVLRPFFTAVCFALILVVATWPAFERLQHMLGGRRTLAALLMVTLATLVLVVPPALVASSMDYNVAGTIRAILTSRRRWSAPGRRRG